MAVSQAVATPNTRVPMATPTAMQKGSGWAMMASASARLPGGVNSELYPLGGASNDASTTTTGIHNTAAASTMTGTHNEC